VDIITGQDLVVGRKILGPVQARPSHPARILSDVAVALRIYLLNPAVILGLKFQLQPSKEEFQVYSNIKFINAQCAEAGVEG
jgi:hypothetical protein